MKLLFLCILFSFAVAQGCDNVHTAKIIAGQHITSGEATVYNTNGFLHLNLKGTDGWLVQAIHVYVGLDEPSSLSLGQFNFVDEFEATSERKVVIPIDFDCHTPIKIAIHTEMLKIDGFSVQKETGWVEGILFDNNRWGYYFQYNLVCDCSDSGLYNKTIETHIDQCCSCEGGGCEPVVTPIYAGQTMHSGDLLIENGVDHLTLTLQSAQPWLMTEIHVFIGTEVPDTISPGKFSWQISFPAGINYYQLRVRIINGELVLDDGTSPVLWNEKFDGLNFAPGSELKIAVHTSNIDTSGAISSSSETGWAYGDWPIDPREKRWGWGLTYTFCSSPSPQPSSGCTYTQGYWKTHNKYANQYHKRIDWPLSEDTMLCDITYYQNLKTAPKGSSFLILAHQYIAAILNVANGAENSVSAELEMAKQILDCSGISKDVLLISKTLDDYNNGLIGPGHCGDQNTVKDSLCECRCVDSPDTLPQFELDVGESLSGELKTKKGSKVDLVVLTGHLAVKRNNKRSLNDKYEVLNTGNTSASGFIQVSYEKTKSPPTGILSGGGSSTNINMGILIGSIVMACVVLAIIILVVIIVVKKRNSGQPFFIMKEYN